MKPRVMLLTRMIQRGQDFSLRCPRYQILFKIQFWETIVNWIIVEIELQNYNIGKLDGRVERWNIRITFDLAAFDNKVNVTHIESRRSQMEDSEYDIFINVESSKLAIEDLLEKLQLQIPDDVGNVKAFPTCPEEPDVVNQYLELNTNRRSKHLGHCVQRTKQALSYIFLQAAFKKFAVANEILRLQNNIPQLEDVAKFLKERTGFTVRPVAGYLSSRDFLAGLAFRLGLASLGASDFEIAKLASHVLTDAAIKKPFNPDKVIEQECQVSTYQDAYFVSESFKEAQNQIREFALNIKRPFTVRYDPYSQSVMVLEKARKRKNREKDKCKIENKNKNDNKKTTEKQIVMIIQIHFCIFKLSVDNKEKKIKRIPQNK
uniref:Tryptophan-5-hydroxylase n=1 Tax=Callistoctopus minor TaxID=515824 RepID=A0AAU7P2W1_CALMC